MGIGSLGWVSVVATGDGGGDGGGVSGFAGMTIVGSGSRAFVVIVVGGIPSELGSELGCGLGDEAGGELGIARGSGRGTGFSGPAAIT
jgi:hypothetical protein